MPFPLSKGGVPAPAATKKGRRKTVSPKARSARVAQGRYMGAIRTLTFGDKAKVKKTRAEKGIDEALKLAASLAKK